MSTRSVPVQIQASNGGPPGHGEAIVHDSPLGERLQRAGVVLLIGLACGLLILPIPLVHLFILLVLPVAAVIAVKRLRARVTLESARGVCPNCGESGQYFVGVGWRAFRLPVATSCPSCGMLLRLERPRRPPT